MGFCGSNEFSQGNRCHSYLLYLGLFPFVIRRICLLLILGHTKTYELMGCTGDTQAWNIQTSSESSLIGPVGQVYALVVGNDFLFAGVQVFFSPLVYSQWNGFHCLHNSIVCYGFVSWCCAGCVYLNLFY